VYLCLTHLYLTHLYLTNHQNELLEMLTTASFHYVPIKLVQAASSVAVLVSITKYTGHNNRIQHLLFGCKFISKYKNISVALKNNIHIINILL